MTANNMRTALKTKTFRKTAFWPTEARVLMRWPQVAITLRQGEYLSGGRKRRPKREVGGAVAAAGDDEDAAAGEVTGEDVDLDIDGDALEELLAGADTTG